MSATAPVRRPAQLRRPAALHVPAAAPSRSASQPKTSILPRPRLVLVAPQRTTAGRLPFLILTGAVMVGGLVAVLMLHTLAAQDAFRITGLQQRLATLTDQEQAQVQVVADDASPTALQARAIALGMVPSAITKFHRRPDGRAVAVQTPVYVAPVVHTKPAKVAKSGTSKSGTASASPTSGKHQSKKAGTSSGSPNSSKHQSKKHKKSR